MSDLAISAHNLSKRFTRHTEKRTSLKERLVRGKGTGETQFWALRDATFDVPRGRTFGIVGHNGSGKSTALKVLTGIYRPTSGSVEVNGRVSALLELGAGFHPELSGRENIRLNGAILGLSRKAIDSMMDEIIDFSGIGDFVDSPVKVYSSGMFVRLGFAIAVKLEPEILIVDEIIAVGDEEFQRKCHDYLFELRNAGSTIVLVSHSMDTVEELCDQAMWLDRGQVQALGEAREVVRQYIASVDEAEIASRAADPTSVPVRLATDATGSGEVRVTKVEFLNEHGEPTDVWQSRSAVTLRFHYTATIALPTVVFGFAILSDNDVTITARNSREAPATDVAVGPGVMDYRIPDLTLQSGTYRVSTMLGHRGHVFDARDRQFAVTVRGPDPTTGGYVVLPGDWQDHRDR